MMVWSPVNPTFIFRIYSLPEIAGIMDLADEIAALKSSAEEQLPLLNTADKIENALLLPFFETLGYSPYDVRQVEPGFTIRLEDGEVSTIDHTLKKDGSPAILVQSREIGTNLTACDPESLLESLRASNARIAALTDGIDYHFYADLERFYASLKGDAPAERHPFFTFHLLRYDEAEIEDLRRLTKPAFKADGILSFAHQLKYRRLFRDYIEQQVASPDNAFVKFLAEQIHEGKAPKGDPGMYESSVREAIQQLIEEGGRGKPRSSFQDSTKGEEAGRDPVSQNQEPASREIGNGDVEVRDSVDRDFGEVVPGV